MYKREPVTAVAPEMKIFGEESPDSAGREVPFYGGCRRVNLREGKRNRKHTAGSDSGKGETAV